jgi:hypothetical protein
MEARVPWCRALVRRSDGAEVVTLAVDGPGVADLAAVDLVAALGLWARRSGLSLVLRDTSDELVELLALAGLAGEVVGQPEEREDPIGVEEERHGADPSV